jgi:hypothetical protein
MGNYCNCSKALIDGEKSTQCEFGEKLNLLAEIKKKFEKYNNSEYIPQEELDKLISSFPNSEELISEFEQKTKDLIQSKEEIISTPNTESPSGRGTNQEIKIIEIDEPIKFYGDDDQYSVYNFNVTKDYYFTGKGYHITNNFLYHGNIENNKSNGKGILINRNGNSVYGDWENGQCTGKGILKIKNLLEYEGDFVNNIKQGHGIEKYSDGTTYEGEFKDNKKNGKGKCLLSNDEIYEGEFNDDLYDGEGTYKWPSESREYIGHFTKGVIDGKGINKYGDGSVYEGYYKKGIKHGYGTYTWPNGKICKGNWVNNKLHGNASFEDGDKKYNITFRFGKIITASEVDENKIVRFEIDNIVNKENIDNIEKYQCSFCRKLIYNPHKCSKCDKNYCLSCIKGEGDKHKNCVFCGEDKYETNIDLSSDLIHNIKVYCDNCKSELNYETAINHIHQ